MNQDEVRHGVCVGCGHVKELAAYQMADETDSSASTRVMRGPAGSPSGGVPGGVWKRAIGICFECREACRSVHAPCPKQKEGCLCADWERYMVTRSGTTWSERSITQYELEPKGL